MAAPTADGNPFRVHGVVQDEFFTDRVQELATIRRVLREPGAKLLVYGPRRMGKTSALVRAIQQHEAAGKLAFLADVSTATTLVDIANRILESAVRAVGKRWRDAVTDVVSRLGVSLTLTPDPSSGLILPSLDVGLRNAALDEQRKSLANALEAIEALARQRKTTLGVVLDEFQEITRFGGDAAEWHLRGIIQHHRHVCYVLAGSEAHIITRMLDKGRAFYGLADHLQFGPIDPGHLAQWIDERLTGARVKAHGVGAAIVSAVGPRTRDIVLVARECFDNRVAAHRAMPEDVSAAIDNIVAAQHALLESLWMGLSALQQNVLRAVGADTDGLTTAASLRKFGLSSSGSATNAATALVNAGHLLKAASATGYVFDNPFFKRWVQMRTLADVGVRTV
jgi:hypothetical protein